MKLDKQALLAYGLSAVIAVLGVAAAGWLVYEAAMVLR